MPKKRLTYGSDDSDNHSDAGSDSDDAFGAVAPPPQKQQQRSKRAIASMPVEYDNSDDGDSDDDAESDNNNIKEDDDDDDSDVEILSSDGDEDEELEDMEEEPIHKKKKRSRRNKGIGSDLQEEEAAPTRKSSRATKSTRTMQEVCDDDGALLVVDTDDDEEDSDDDIKIKPKQNGRAKRQKREGDVTQSTARGNNSSASDNKTKRVGKLKAHKSLSQQSDDDDSSVATYHTEDFKISRILATETKSRKEWNALAKTMNTSEITYSSRWHQDPPPGHTEEDMVKKFLVKWNDLSHLHVSWELQQDLVNFIEGSKTCLSVFRRKADPDDGLLYDVDERCDGDYFDPGWIQVDRILHVEFPDTCPITQVDDEETVTNQELGIVLDRNDPNFDNGWGRQFLVKWNNQPYSESTFEYERDLILNGVDYKTQLAAFYRRSEMPDKAEALQLHKDGESEKRRLYNNVFGERAATEPGAVEVYQKMLESHVFQNGGQLRDYQAEGVAWLMQNFLNDRPSILADEMGLGKTIQCAAFLNLLATEFHRRGPFLIVVPLTTLGNWEKELHDWVDLNTIVYHGSAEDRKVIRMEDMARVAHRPDSSRQNELFLRKCRSKMQRQDVPGNPWMTEVVLTTPELLCKEDYTELTAIDWEVVIVDEAHRLKNHESKFANNLRDTKFQFGHKILMTGTPIQNNVKEFWCLLNFLKPEEFGDVDSFLEKYGEMKCKETLDSLHEEIRPFILRRLKEDVEKSVPPKEETIIEVELTLRQKQYYRALYEKNLKFLHKNKAKPQDGPSLLNLAMQLRKVCNHLFLLNGAEEDFHEEQLKKNDNQPISEGDLLVKSSGKLVLLDKLLPRLKENGHRVLIFSQFKIMLDVLEDYLRARKMKCERIDGSITGKARQQAIDRFQVSESASGKEAPFVMLLSTRAGGVGINLTAADTCIIFDSDWNPQNDLQAQARCHRIGQTKDVKVYRLLTSKTYELHLFDVSSRKMGLDQAVLHGFEAGKGQKPLSKEELEQLLRQGAYSIFNEEKAGAAEAESNAFQEQSIDSILERRARTVKYENTGSNSKAAGGAFSKARFTAAKSPDAKGKKTSDIDIQDPEFWSKMVGDAPDEEDEQEAQNMPKKRSRNIDNYALANRQSIGSDVDADEDDDAAAVEDSDDDFDHNDESEESSDEGDFDLDDDILGDKPARKRKKSYVFSHPVPPTDITNGGIDSDTTSQPVLVGQQAAGYAASGVAPSLNPHQQLIAMQMQSQMQAMAQHATQQRHPSTPERLAYMRAMRLQALAGANYTNPAPGQRHDDVDAGARRQG